MRATILWGHTMGLYNKLYPDMFLCDEVAYLRKNMFHGPIQIRLE